MRIQTISIEASNVCNLSCGFCDIEKIRNGKKYFITPDGFNNLDIKKLKLNVAMVGRVGDPIFNPDITDLTSIVKDADTKLFISTNGTMRDKKWWHDFASYMPRDHVIYFAIDGTTPDVYSFYRRGGVYQKAIDNMKSFIDGGGNATWQFILFKHNQHQLDDLDRLSKEYGCNYVVLSSNFYDHKYKAPEFENKLKSNAEVMDLEVFKCRLKLGEIFISAMGHYHPCCGILEFGTVLRFVNMRIKSIYNERLSDVLDSGYYDRILEKTNKFPACKKCMIFIKITEE